MKSDEEKLPVYSPQHGWLLFGVTFALVALGDILGTILIGVLPLSPFPFFPVGSAVVLCCHTSGALPWGGGPGCSPGRTWCLPVRQHISHSLGDVTNQHWGGFALLVLGSGGMEPTQSQ